MRRLVVVAAFLALVLAACDEQPAGTATPEPTGAAETAATAATTPSTATATAASQQQTAERLGTYSDVKVTAVAPDFAALAGAKAHFGTLGNAVYRIEMPAHWNGELVLWAHGFAGFGTEVGVENPRAGFRRALIADGFAWAASSYSENGYVPGIGADDTLALKRRFEQQFGEAKRTYIAGASMGGNVVTLSLEHFPDEYDGALAVCGALAGEEQIDYLISWAMAAEYIGGVELPVGRGSTAMQGAMLGRLTPALGPVEAPTAKGKAFANVMMNLTGGPRPFFTVGYREQYLVNFGLLLADPDRTSLPGKAATNQGHDYEIDAGLGFTGEELNKGVRRLVADGSARDAKAHPDAVPTTGRISDPLLTLHNTGDLFVPITQEVSYHEKVEKAGKTNLLVQRAIRDGGHCKFTDEEVLTAWRDLLGWVRDGKKPAGEDLTGDLRDVGRQFTNPIRAGDPALP